MAIAIFQRAAGCRQEGVPPNNENRSLALLGLARAALLEKQPAVARGYASRSLALGSSRGDVAQVVDALQMLARSFSDTPEGDQAVSILRTAASLVDQVPIDDLDAEKRATWLATPARGLRRAHHGVRKSGQHRSRATIGCRARH